MTVNESGLRLFIEITFFVRFVYFLPQQDSLDGMSRRGYRMEAEVEYTDEFEQWWNGLDMEEQNRISKTILLLETEGPDLGFPHSSAVYSSRHPHMRELRIQHRGRPYRILYAFDPRRTAILLIGGDKTGNERWYPLFVPIADDLYDEHLREIHEEG